jgi:CDP-glucose 4,6-dehydratase
MVHSFFDSSRHTEHGVAVATARAGNVVGGGDWGENRLLPDMMRAFAAGEQVLIRRPASTRPWQHVLDPLEGYLRLARRLVEAGPAYGDGWNFGPGLEGAQPVSWVVERCVRLWGPGASWRQDATTHPAEANLLQLDCTRARQQLDWRPRLPLERTLELTVDWYRQVTVGGADAAALCRAQIEEFAGMEMD